MAASSAPDIREIERFLFREAMYLDRGMYDEWLSLFTEDGLYWVPAEPGQKDPYEQVSLYFEDDVLRRMRVERLRHDRAFSLDRPVRASRIVGNVLLEDGEDRDGSSEILRVRSTFHMQELQLGDKHSYAGFYRHDLVATDAGLKIQLKRVELIDCDQPLEILQSFL